MAGGVRARVGSLFPLILFAVFLMTPLVYVGAQATPAAPSQAEPKEPTFAERVADLEAVTNSGVPDSTHKNNVSTNQGDNAWLLASSALVLMMTGPGLALFYGGLVRTKNVLSTFMHSMFLMCLVSLLWLVIGYSLAFGEGGPFLGSFTQHFMLKGVGAKPPGSTCPRTSTSTSSSRAIRRRRCGIRSTGSPCSRGR